MFCGSAECKPTCPAYVDKDIGRTHCMIINSQLDTESAKRETYRTMKRKLEEIDQ